MNSLVIPSSPNWYETTVFACAPDNTVIYGSRSDLVIIKPKDLSEPAEVKIISRAHQDKIKSVSVSPAWEKRKLAVSVALDKTVKLWNIEDYSLQLSHRAHTADPTDVVGVTFAGSDRIVSVSTDGVIVVWRFGPNELVPLKGLLGVKSKVTCLSACPHCNWLVAFGMFNGLIIVTDLRKNGKVLYKLRGHDEAILSFSWCPTQHNILQQKKVSSENTEILTIKEDSAKTNILNAKPTSKNANLWANLKHADDEEIEAPSESRPLPQHFDITADDCFAVETPCGDNNEKEETPKKLVAKRSITKPKTVPAEDVLKEDEVEDFLASCAALKRQILNVNQSSGMAEPIGDETLQKIDASATNEDSSKTTTLSDKKDFLLASSSKAGNVIYIWTVGTESRLQAELHLSGRQQRYKLKNSPNAHWITLLWVTPTILLSSSKQGELLSWDLKKLQGKGHDLKPTLIHNDHASALFSIAAPIELNKEEEGDWRKEHEVRVWTMGQDKYILNTSLAAGREVSMSYPTIGGQIQCLVQSPLDPNRVAIGIGDGTTAVWDLSKPHVQCITMKRLYQKMSSKIISLAWHPTKEAILAYGTYEGRIGIADTLNLSKSPTLMTQYFNKGIYELQWGPMKNYTHFGLYACAQGKVVVYNTEKPFEDPFLIPTPQSEQITQFTWNQDYSILTVGAKSGTIFFYTPDFSTLHATYHQQKAVQCLLWHPEAFTVGSNYYGWLASCTNDVSFVVYNCACLFDSEGSRNREVTVVGSLTGHSGSVRCLSWNPHDGSKLVSAGEDSVAQVWDVPSRTIVASYLGHATDGILAVLWSPLDTDFIISGGRDCILRIWKVSECPPVQPSVLESVSKSKRKPFKTEENQNTQQQNQTDAPKTKKILDSVSKLDSGAVTTLIDDCRRLFLTQHEHSESNGKTHKLDALDIFKTRDDVLKLLDCEEKRHLKTGKRLQAHHISLWKGDISETIKQAIDNGTVTPFLISLAPMVSPKLWQEACDAYSKKLTESTKSDPLEVAAYFLACHKVEEAVQALLSGGLFREALALTKSRLGEQDSLVPIILERWATASMFDGNFEIAAQCYVALGRLEDAVKLLFRRSDETTLKLALDIAKQINNEDLHKAVLSRYNSFKNEQKEEGVTNGTLNSVKNDSSLEEAVKDSTPNSLENEMNDTGVKEDNTPISKEILKNTEVVN